MYNEVNLANAYLYSGRLAEALSLYESILKATESRVPWKVPEIQASIGLVALALQDRKYARAMWRETKSLSLSNLIGVQDRFKIAWLNAFMILRDDPDQALEILEEGIRRERLPDRSSYLKLKWLKVLASQFTSRDPTESSERRVKAELKQVGMGWFVYFSRRWMNRIMQTQATSY